MFQVSSSTSVVPGAGLHPSVENQPSPRCKQNSVHCACDWLGPWSQSIKWIHYMFYTCRTICIHGWDSSNASSNTKAIPITCKAGARSWHARASEGILHVAPRQTLLGLFPGKGHGWHSGWASWRCSTCAACRCRCGGILGHPPCGPKNTLVASYWKRRGVSGKRPRTHCGQACIWGKLQP